jgi:hypothetical protein
MYAIYWFSFANKLNRICDMPPLDQTMTNVLSTLVQSLPIGTNLGMFRFLWMLCSGHLLSSRGALFPALLALGLDDAEVRRAWAAFRYGSWTMATLLLGWKTYVETEGRWQAQRHGGYRVRAVDITAFWRPKLKGCPSKHFHALAGRALPAVIIGITAQIGQIGAQRVAIPTQLLRVRTEDGREATLQAELLREVASDLADDEVGVFDAGFGLRELQEAGVGRYVVRLACNVTTRRAVLPDRAPDAKGRPREYGDIIRPLARRYRDHDIAASPPDQQVCWTVDGVKLRADLWHHLVRRDCKVADQAPRFSIAVVHDPRFTQPWVLAFNLPLSVAEVTAIYRNRWPVEQIPLAGKQMLGAQRQFVFAPESCQRLPQLALLAGSILTYVAATSPAIPTGFWDRDAQPTPGRLRRAMARLPFPNWADLPPRLRKKASVTAHLPKGVAGHRRRKAA